MRKKLVWWAKKLLRFSKISFGFFLCDTQKMCNAKFKVECFEIHLFDRNSCHYRWCSGTAADLQAVDMGSIPERGLNSNDR